LNLILLEPCELNEDGTAELRGRRAKHLMDVLGAEVGRRLRVGVLNGPRGQAEVRVVQRDRVVVSVDLNETPSAQPKVDLVLAMPRPKALRRLLPWLAAMGVGRIDVVNAWRVDKSYLGSPLLERAALRESLILGCEQGITTWLPEIHVHRRLMSFVEQLEGDDERIRILAEPGEEGIQHLHPLPTPSRYLLAIGPDGGWVQRELETFTGLGFRAVSLGDGVLRVETAVVSALAQLDLLVRLGALALPG